MKTQKSCSHENYVDDEKGGGGGFDSGSHIKGSDIDPIKLGFLY